MPIHDQSYRRYEGAKAPPGRAWLVIAKAGIINMIRKRLFLGLLILSWIPFLVRAGQIYFSTNFPQMAMLAATAETFRQYLEQQNPFVFFMTIYVGAGLDCQRSPGQCAADLPVEAAAALRVHRRQGVGALLLPAAHYVGARHFPAPRSGLVRRELPVPAQEPLSLPGHHGGRAAAGAPGDVHDAGLVVAVEEQPLRLDSLRRHHLLHHGDLRRPLRHHRQLGDVVVVAEREPGAGRRRHLPRHRRATARPGRFRSSSSSGSSSCRFRFSSGGSAASRWSRERARREHSARASRSLPPSTSPSGTGRSSGSTTSASRCRRA